MEYRRIFGRQVDSYSDLMLEISRGNMSGMCCISKFGGNTSVADGTDEDIWDGGGDYSYPATALMTSMSQTTDQATMRGGIIELQGLDADWNVITQTKALDASDTTTVITLDTPMIRVFRMKVLANVVLTATVRCHNAGETVDYAIMGIGNNQTLMALYTVPNGKTAYMTSYYGDTVESTGKEPKSVEFAMFMADRDNGYEFQLKHSKGIPKAGAGFQHFFKPYLKINQKTDIRMNAAATAEDAHVHSGFDLILIDN